MSNFQSIALGLLLLSVGFAIGLTIGALAF